MADPDLEFARIAVERGWTRREFVDACFRIRDGFREQGLSPVPRIGELLYRNGYITLDQLTEGITATAGTSEHRYRLGEKLGAGAMGDVWKAWDSQLDRTVALKLLKSATPEDIARFKREAQTAGRLNHPNIAAIHEVGELHGRHFIAMQFVDGETLCTFPRTDLRLVISLLRDACLALHAAHEAGFIHRDIKPANLMVERVQPPRMYVLDFGLAKSLDRTHSMNAAGTPSYMSPEQAVGAASIDGRSDVYSIGATLYDLLVGQAPFIGTDVYDVLNRVIQEDPVPPRKFKPAVDPDLEKITLKCLEKGPSRRYPSARALADDLARWLDGEPVSAQAPSLVYRARRWLGRKRGIAIASAVALAAVAAGTAFGVDQWRKARASERQRLEEGKKREAAEFYTRLEKDLELLRMRFCQPGYRMDEGERRKYAELERRIAAYGDTAQGWHLIGRCRDVAGRPLEAEEAWDRALAIDPAHGPSLIEKGRMLLRSSAHLRRFAPTDDHVRSAIALAERGANFVARGIAAQGGDADIRGDLAQVESQVVREWQRGTFTAQKMMAKWAQDPFVSEFLLCEAQSTAVNTRKLDAATRALGSLPSHPGVCLMVGTARLEGRDYEGAGREFDRALEIHPWAWEAWFLRAHFHHTRAVDPGRDQSRKERREILELAISDLNRAVDLHPGSVAALLFRGTVYMEVHDLAEAMRDFTRALELDPRLPSAYLNRGAVHMALEEFELSIRDFSRAIELNPRSMEAHANRGTAYRMMGSFADAMKDFDTVIGLAPASPDGYDGRGNVYFDQNQFDLSIQEHTRAVERAPGSAHSLTFRAAAWLQKGDLDSAWNDCSAAILASPGHAHAYFTRGKIHRHRREHSAALADFGETIRLDPRHGGAYLTRGNLRQDLGDLDGAFSDFSEVIRLEPANQDGYFNRGLLLYHKNKWDEAIADLSKAIELSPRRADTYLVRGLARSKKRDFRGAVADYDQCLGLEPRNPDALANRGIARKWLGLRELAVADLESALNFAPAEWPNREKIAKVLAELRR